MRTLALISRLRSYPAGALIVLAGEPPQAMYTIVAGRVKLTRIAPNGREQIINVMGPEQHFNAVPIFDEGPCPVNVEAITDVEVLELPITAMRQVGADHPALAMALLREFAGLLRHMVNLIDNIALHSVQGRLAQLLLRRATASEKGELVAPLTQTEMAAMTVLCARWSIVLCINLSYRDTFVLNAARSRSVIEPRWNTVLRHSFTHLAGDIA